MFNLTLNEFKSTDPSKLIDYVKNGIDIYQKLENDDYEQLTFYEVAVCWGTSELVKACIEKGANPDCVNLERAARSSPPAVTSSLVSAINSFNPATLRVLLESGANPSYLYVGNLQWHLRSNILPEFEHLQDFTSMEQDQLLSLKKSLDVGTEIIAILRDYGFHIPGINLSDRDISFYQLSYSYAEMSVGGSYDDEEHVWYNRTPEDEANESFDDFLDKYPGDYSEGYDTDGWPCFLPDHGYRPNALWHSVSPEALRRRLDSGANINERDSYGYTMLHHLAFHGGGDYYFKPEVMLQILIDAGSDVNDCNKSGVCPLLLAAVRIRPQPKSLEIVKVLLRNGADFYSNLSNGNGSDIIYWASQYWYVNGDFEREILREIVEELGREATGETKLSAEEIDIMTTAFWGESGNLEPLLKRGVNINARTKHNYTPLMFASVYNKAETVKFLIDNGASVDCRNDSGDNALSLARQTEDESVIAILVGAGVK